MLLTACLKLILFTLLQVLVSNNCSIFHQLNNCLILSSIEKQFSLVEAIMITTSTGSAIYVNTSIFSPSVELYTVNFSFLLFISSILVSYEDIVYSEVTELN